MYEGQCERARMKEALQPCQLNPLTDAVYVGDVCLLVRADDLEGETVAVTVTGNKEDERDMRNGRRR